MGDYLIISTTTDLLRVAQSQIVYITSDGNYSTLVLSDGEARLITLQLGEVEEMIQRQLDKKVAQNFIRLGRQLIINRRYIFYINLPHQRLTLSDNSSNKYTVSASRDALKKLKEAIETERS